jgi:hypothetical protein
MKVEINSRHVDTVQTKMEILRECVIQVADSPASFNEIMVTV